MLITISGLSGSGKSTAAKGLSERLGIPTVDVGKIFRGMAAKRGMDVVAFGAFVEKHPEIDRELDDAMLRLVKRRKRLILQSRLAGLMTAREGLKAFRIWIAATARTRASRVARREGIPFRKALSDITRRDRNNRVRYVRTYGLDLNDLSVYDIVVRTDNLTLEEVVSCLAKELTNVWPKRRKTPRPKRKTSRSRPPKRLPRKR
jgi:predicted cytidylate kinase